MLNGWDDLFGCDTDESESAVLSAKPSGAVLSAKAVDAVPSADSTSVLPYYRKVEVAKAPSTILTPSLLKMEGNLIRTRLEDFTWESREQENKTPALKIAMCVVGFPSLRNKSGGEVTEMIGQVVSWEELYDRSADPNIDVEGLKEMTSKYVNKLNSQGRSFIGECIPDLVKAALQDGLLPIFNGSAGHKMTQLAANAAYRWQQLQGDSDMAIGYREFGPVIGGHKDYARILLEELIDQGYLQLVSKGRPGRQSRYRFIGREENGVLIPNN